MLAASESGCNPEQLARSIAEQNGLGAMSQELRRGVLVELVKQLWGPLPSFSTLSSAEISEIAKATVGTGVVPIFIHPITNDWHAVVLRPGTHYRGPRYKAEANDHYYMIAGGFINLTETPGIQDLVASNPNKAESPVEGALRELIEEVVDDKGEAILKPSPSRIFPMDALTLSFPSGERRLVIGYVVQLIKDEIYKVIAHVDRIASDEVYRRACRQHTVNSDSGMPEVCQVGILPLADLAANNYKLLHPDQRGLFQRIARFLSLPSQEYLS